jgi:hypothetical protein
MTLSANKFFIDILDKAQSDKINFTEKLEAAKGDDIFKYILLMNTSALEEYITQTRLQAEQSFQLTKIVATAGFGLLVVGITLGIYSAFLDRQGLDAAYLTSMAGIIIEFMSGVYFYLYNKTLQQLNLFHDKMISLELVSMSFISNSLIIDEKKRDECKKDLSEMLISSSSKLL